MKTRLESVRCLIRAVSIHVHMDVNLKAMPRGARIGHMLDSQAVWTIHLHLSIHVK